MPRTPHFISFSNFCLIILAVFIECCVFINMLCIYKCVALHWIMYYLSCNSTLVVMSSFLLDSVFSMAYMHACFLWMYVFKFWVNICLIRITSYVTMLTTTDDPQPPGVFQSFLDVHWAQCRFLRDWFQVHLKRLFSDLWRAGAIVRIVSVNQYKHGCSNKWFIASMLAF